MNLVVDIETDSLDATKIHCIVARNMETNENIVEDVLPFEAPQN